MRSKGKVFSRLADETDGQKVFIRNKTRTMKVLKEGPRKFPEIIQDPLDNMVQREFTEFVTPVEVEVGEGGLAAAGT